MMEVVAPGGRAPQSRTWLLWLGISASVAAVALFIIIGPLKWFEDVTTTQSLSPDKQHRVYLVEKVPNMPLKIDRNFVVDLATLNPDSHHEVTRARIFHSPDEGRPIGTERFVWSRDSSYVLLVGKHFYVSTELPTPEGEQAYWLYHLPTGQSWCNSDQIADPDELLMVQQLREIDFVAPVLH